MDDIEQRLKDTSQNLFKAYEAWGKSRLNAEAREELQECLHELRKVAARLEIEIASSERQEMAQRPIAIPPHRSQRQQHPNSMGASGDFDEDDFGNQSDEGQSQPKRFQGNRPQHQQRQGSGGQGSGQQGGFRRPMRRPHQGGGAAPVAADKPDSSTSE
jgi:hypothetical protein